MDTHLHESGDNNSNRKGKQATDEAPSNEVRESKRQRKMHDYHLLDDPWADEDSMGETTGMIHEMANMTSAERVYTVSSELNVTPDNSKNLREVQESPDWLNWEKAIKAELDQCAKHKQM